MINLHLVYGLLIAHCIGDFWAQNNSMATRKSSSNLWLLAHTLTYSACFFWLGWSFCLITLVLHTLTDYVTSRLTAKLWFISLPPLNTEGYGIGRVMVWPVRRHWFFVVIGVDQCIHAITLLWTLTLLNS